ncbi:LOW QUALITY PROTEIN: hypothetical protein BDA96_03G421500 [Sorghum bicolor]|uniref:Uncharacterized protein n=1 Tax=Sorghum bicolor TaxID=4558 RepID=A0A921UQ79_SORBI|nr:LOW QUALITY PROTEIN: hypothetical protein BDA96_03G421500 [Sorghum bicolor]
MSTLDGGAREDVMVKQQEGIKDRSGFLYWRTELVRLACEPHAGRGLPANSKTKKKTRSSSSSIFGEGWRSASRSIARAPTVFLDQTRAIEPRSGGRSSPSRSPSVGYALDELLNDFVPCDEMRHLLVPATPAPNPPCPLLFAQVTRLRCGGVVLGLALHHSVVDARSAAHFVETWASIARGGGGGGGGGDAPLPPCFDHRLLSARPPATRAVLYDHPEYKPEPAPEHAVAAGSAYASAIITLSKSQVSALKARCAGASTFRAVVALVWHARAARGRSRPTRLLPADAETRLFSMVDMRARLAPPLPLPPGYFGNAVIRTSALATVGEVVGNPVGYAAPGASASPTAASL